MQRSGSGLQGSVHRPGGRFWPDVPVRWRGQEAFRRPDAGRGRAPVPLELAHQSDLAVQLFYTVQKINRCAFGVHAFGQSTFQTAVVGRNGDHLECAGKHGTKGVAPLDLKDFAVAALADELADVPSAEKWFVPLVIFRFHI